MKTTIIRLERHDDFISARDKMGWAKGGRILLVWPEGEAVMNRRLDLALLQRHSAALGAQLGVVAQDPEVRYHAPRLGIPVFKSLRQAEKDAWRLPRRFRGAAFSAALSARGAVHDSSSGSPDDQATGENVPQATAWRRLPPKPERLEPALPPAQRLVWFLLGVAAVLAIAAVLTPSATLRLTPQTQVQDVLMEVWSTPGAAAAELTGQLPARWVRVHVEGRDTRPASGSMRVAEQPAAGEVRFTNLTDAIVEIPAGAVALTVGDDPVRFAVSRAGSLPAGPGTSVILPVQALQPGEAGNLPAGSLTALEGLLGTQVSAANPRPTRGGTSRTVPAPTAADRVALQTQLTQALEATALEELQRQVAPGDLPIPASLRRVETAAETFQPEEGLPADQLALSLSLEFEALVTPAEDLQALAEAIFNANLAAGFTPVPGTLKVEMVSAPTAEPVPEGGEPVYRWQMHAYRQIAAQGLPAEAIRLALGRSPSEAQRRLEAALPLDGPVEVTLQPRGWPRLPILPFRVTVIVTPAQ